jgi:glycosyltransferase involved in cell wall biosynthesis
MASSDLLVLPDLATDRYSNLYTSPMKLFEYMASKRPIVSANVPSLLEVLSDKTAFLFESGSSESLANKIKEALADEAHCSKLSDNAFDTVSHFTWEKRGEDIVNLINKTLK